MIFFINDWWRKKEFFTKCTTRHLCVENNKKDLSKIKSKLLSEEISHRDVETQGGAGNIDAAVYLDNEDIIEIEEETNTITGNEGLNYKTKKGESINKDFDTKEESDLYKQRTENQFMTRRIGGTY